MKRPINPPGWISGPLVLFWGRFKALMPDGRSRQHVAQRHTVGAFLIIDVFRVTAGHTLLTHIKAVITGRGCSTCAVLIAVPAGPPCGSPTFLPAEV